MNEFLVRAIYWMSLLLIIGMDAYGDAEIDEKRKRNHLVESIGVLSWFVVIVMFYYYPVNWWWIAIDYVLIRFSFFDIIYNKSRKLSTFYIGGTDPLDKVKKKIPFYLYVTLVFLSFFFSLAVIFWNVYYY